MEIEEIVENMKSSLNNADFSNREFNNLLKALIEKKGKIVLLDFESNSFETREYVKKRKQDAALSKHFDWALCWMKLEGKLKKYRVLQEEFDIFKSDFHFEDGVLFYFYLGTENNDKAIKKIIFKYLTKLPTKNVWH